MRKLFEKSNYVKHWQLLSVLGITCIIITLCIAVWMILGDYWSWIWIQGNQIILLFTFFGFIFICTGWWIFCIRKLISTQGKGNYRYMKISTAVVMGMIIFSTFYFHEPINDLTNKPLIVLVGPVPSSTAVITCYTALPQSNLELQYNLKDSPMTNQIPDSGDHLYHRFFLTNLQWNATYEYHLIATTTKQSVPVDLSQTQVFKTTPRNSADGLKFLSTADIHSAMPPQLANQIAQMPADVIIEGGDLVDYGSVDAEWDGYFSSTKPIYSRTNLENPAPLLLPVVGNHDALFFGKKNFGMFFSGVGNGSTAPFYYRVDIGDVHFIALDLEWGLESFSEAQELWLNQTLAGINPADWTIVITHCHIYSSGSFGTFPEVTAKMTPIFKNGNVDLVISGHEHHYERLLADGITYIITGTGGLKFDSPKETTCPESQLYITGQSIFGSYSITNNTMDFKAYYANGSIADSTTIFSI